MRMTMDAGFSKRAILLALTATACLLAAALLPVATAHAEDGLDGDGNVVNTQQVPDSSFIYDTSIIDLSTADTYYDNQTVQVVGEAVGDNLRADLDGRHRWITLSAESGSATISVYMTTEMAAKVDTLGAYAATGTMLQVRGTYHLVCPDHEGISDLHAEAVAMVARGETREDEFDFNEFVPGVVVVAVGLAMLGVYYWLRERQR